MDNELFLLNCPNIPTLHPGELLYSWCGHVHRWNGNAHALDTSRRLFGTPYAALLHDIPAHLDVLVARTAGSLGDAGTLAQKNTLLGYFLSFVGSEVAHATLASIEQGSERNLKAKLGIAASRVGSHHPLKGCVDCFDDDEAEFGVAFWRVEHQYPSACVCRRHQRPLHIAWDPTTPVHRRDWLLPRSGPARTWLEYPVKNDAQLTKLIKLNAFSKAAAEQPIGALDPQTIAWTYQAGLKSRGMLTRAGSLRLDQVVAIVRNEYAGLEGLPGFHILNSLGPDWSGFAGSLARKRPRSGHPFKHLLFMTTLFATWEEFVAAYQTVLTCPPDWLETREQDHAKPADPRIGQFASMVRTRGLSVRAAAIELGVSVTTGVRWACTLGIEFTSRAKTLTPAVLNGVRAALADGKTKRDVMADNHISAVSLNRLISSEPDVRAAWLSARHAAAQATNRDRFLTLIAENPGVPVKAIRKIKGNGYQWLYRHDREWLIEHLPAIWKNEP